MGLTGAEMTQLNKLAKYLKDLGMLNDHCLHPNAGFSLGAVRGIPYVDVWKAHSLHYWYNLRLDDNSLLFFYREGNTVNFSFIGCPYDCVGFNEYKDARIREGVNRCDINEMYEDYLATTNLREIPYYFRYDYDDTTYREGEHPAAHLHMGFVEGVRIGVRYRLDIMSFMAFILRQTYLPQWVHVLNNPTMYQELYQYKAGIECIASQYYQLKDRDQDFYLI